MQNAHDYDEVQKGVKGGIVVGDADVWDEMRRGKRQWLAPLALCPIFLCMWHAAYMLHYDGVQPPRFLGLFPRLLVTLLVLGFA
jgi:hypothetical protein